MHSLFGFAAESNCTNFYPETGPFYNGSFAEPAAPAQLASGTTIKIVSYNINFAKQLPEIIQDFTTVSELKSADFIVLQEVDGEIGGAKHAAAALAEALKMHYAFSPNMVLWERDYGNAVLSQWPIESARKVLLPLSGSEDCNQRSALGVIAKIGDKKVQIYSLHLSVRFPDSIGSDRSRAKQVEPAINTLNQAGPTLPTYIAGDFNSFNPWGWTSVAKAFEAGGFINGQPASGWTYRPRQLELDHAFVRGFEVKSSGIAYDSKGSDHIPIWSELTLK